MSLKNDLHSMKGHLEKVLERAGRLHNQNLADIIRSGVERLTQALDHPDIDNVENETNNAPPVDPINSGGNMVFAAGDPGRTLADQEAARRAAFPAPGAFGGVSEPLPQGAGDGGASEPAPVRPGTQLDPDAKHPGDPKFQNSNQNPDFTNPNAVNLNDDGTLKTAPNSLGKTDDRDGGDKK